MTGVRPVSDADAADICEIYNHYVLRSTVTFEEKAVSSRSMSERINKVFEAGLPWLGIEDGEQFCGYAYATPWRSRSAYRHSVETTVYVAQDCQGRGIGRQLYDRLFADLRATPARVAIGGITLPNAASVALHEKLGMEKVAHFREVGFKFGRWLDVGYWQCRL